MQVSIKPNCAIIVGTVTKDAEYKTIGEKNTPVVTFSVAVNNYGEPGAFANCKAFGERLANYARNIKKGDAVCAMGAIESREYNGKTYKDLNCQWLNFVGLGSTPNTPNTPMASPPPVDDATMQSLYGTENDDDDDLPF